jgi:hypothetical protein
MPLRAAPLLALLCLVVPPALASGPAPDDPTDGRVPVPRLAAEISVDGRLDEPVWLSAAVLRGFSQYLPSDGRPASDSTEVLAWYDATHLYIGIRAYEDHGEVRATLADRDRLSGEDYVTLVLDTFDDRREAYALTVNPFGAQSDGILRDAVRSAGSFGTTSVGGNYSIDTNPDFVFESKGRLAPFGYEIEVSVPFKSLRYQSALTQDWGFNVIRKTQHSGYVDTWMPVRQDAASFLAQSGRLSGLTDLRRGLVLDINPEITGSMAGGPGGDGWEYQPVDDQYGGNVRWGITNNLVLNGTVNPDFSQVEADVAQFQFDPRRAVFFPEKRPFFLDGSENFASPNPLIYTRQIVNPEGAMKVSGKAGGFTVGVLSAMDDRRTSLSGDDLRTFNAVRLRRDLKGQSTLGLVYTDQTDGGTWNRVAALDGRLVFRDLYSLSWQAAGSFTNLGDGTVAAPLWSVDFSALGRRYGIVAEATGIHGEFVSRTGFISQAGVVNAFIQPRYNFYGAEGAAVESFIGSVSLQGRWDYDRFTAGRIPNDPKLHLNGVVGFRGGWTVSAQLLYESFKYPPELYRDYFVELQDEAGLPVDTVAFTGTDRFTNRDVAFSIGTPRFSTFSGSLFFLYGRDENFFEWAPADILFLDIGIDWSPTDQVRVNLAYKHQEYFRFDDGSVVGIRRVPRIKLEYQVTRDFFVRLVSQYDANFRDALRDNSRTDDPILVRDPATGEFHRTGRQRVNRLRFDGLLSYRPTPGTVVFFGYGSTFDEPDTFRMSGMERLDDGFFVKLSYLFRV